MASSSRSRTARQRKYRIAKRRRVREHFQDKAPAPSLHVEAAGRGGLIDITGSPDAVDEALEATFPASDPPAY
jgi:hypothetical protein